ncbi:MAG: putative phage abortive infection protein [Campylobacter sp.]|uniref:putative phage abortive infection protein n=1 Tax=Campylobacter sp. TaxID=205 RepID=UPI003FA086CB
MKKYLIIFGIFGIGFYVGTLAAYILKDDINSEFLGQVGDFLGGYLNPLFALLSFIALLITIVFQSEELKNSREELRLTREELAKSAEAQERSSQIFEQQRFENTFFSLLKTLNLDIKDFKSNNDRFLENHGDYDNPELKYVANFFRIAILVYEILKFINDYNTNQITSKEQNCGYKRHSNILRACLDADILQLLLIYCCNDNIVDAYNIRQLLEKYNILEYMPIDKSINMEKRIPDDIMEITYEVYIIRLIKKYLTIGHISIFGDNVYIKGLKFDF